MTAGGTASGEPFAGMVQWALTRMIGATTMRYRRASESTLVVLASWIPIGVSLVVGGIHPHWSPSVVLAELPWPVEVLIGAFIAASGGMVLWSTLAPHFSRAPLLESDRWALEAPGLLLGSVGWLTFSIASFTLAPYAFLPWMYSLALSLAAWVRFWRVWRISKSTRSEKSRLDRERGE